MYVDKPPTGPMHIEMLTAKKRIYAGSGEGGAVFSHSNNLLLHAQKAEIAELKATVKAQADHIARTDAKLDTISEQLAQIIRNQNVARAGLAPIPKEQIMVRNMPDISSSIPSK